MRQRKLLDARADTLLHGYQTFTAGRRQGRIKPPLVEKLSIFGTARQHFSAIHPFPYTETAFPQRVESLNREAVSFRNGHGCRVSALHGTAINGCNGKPCQRFCQLLGLHPPMLAEWIVTRTDKAIFAIGKRFAMPGDEEAGDGQGCDSWH